MARSLRVEFSGATYHVVSRGVERRNIFADDDDRRRLLERLDDVSARLGWDLWAYCLMDNHYHLLVKTTRPTLSRGMRDLNSLYSQSFNRKHGRAGHLFQGRYKAFFVDDESYLHAVARYIVLNPARAGRCTHPRDWRWSSYRAVLGEGDGPRCLRSDLTLALFDHEPGFAKRAFARFVMAGIGQTAPPVPLEHELFAGRDPFPARVTKHVPAVSREVPRAQRQACAALVEFAARHPRRDAAIAAAHHSGMYTLAEIGAHFGLHYSSVCRIVRIERAMFKRKIRPPNG